MCGRYRRARHRRRPSPPPTHSADPRRPAPRRAAPLRPLTPCHHPPPLAPVHSAPRQVAFGDVCRGLVIPIYFIFPRLFTCPTMLTPGFKVEFEVNMLIIFNDGHMVTENFPITLYR